MSTRLLFSSGDDVIPNQFTFTDVTGVNPNTTITSSTVTVSGVSANAVVLVTASGGTVDAGTSALSGTFASSKTVQANNSGSFVIAARLTSSSSFTTAVNCIVSINGVSDTFSATTRAADTTPNAFTIADVSSVEPSTLVTSPSSGFVTVSGLEANYNITVSASNGQIDAGTSALSGTWATSKTVTTSATGTLVVAARSTSSSSFSTAVNVAVTVGTGSDTYTITTRAPVLNGFFSFTDISGATRSTVYTSDTVTATGFEPNYAITVSASGGTVDAGTSSLSGTYSSSKTVTTSATGTLVVSAQLTSSSQYRTAANNTITIGNSSDTYTVTTGSGDQTPDPFSFTDVTEADLNTVTYSDRIGFLGFDDQTSWTVTNGEGSMNYVPGFTDPTQAVWSTTGVISPGWGLTLRTTSSSNSNTTKSVTVNVGGTTDTWSVTTRDLVPNPFSFANITDAALSTVYTTETVTVTGLSANVPITVSASTAPGYSSNPTVDAGTSALSGTFATSKTVTTSASGTIVIAARMTSSSQTNTTDLAYIAVGSDNGQSRPWTIQTYIDSVPDIPSPSSQEITNASLNTVYTSNTVTITGLSANISVTVTGQSGTIDAGTSALSGTFTSSKTVTTSSSGSIVVAGRLTSSPNYSTLLSMVITVGSTNVYVFGVRTTSPVGQAEYFVPGTYTWTCPANVTSVCAIAVGGGGSGSRGLTANGRGGGGGGGLGWKNNISVTPGTNYTVVVGAVQSTAGTAGNQSYFINASTVRGGGGGGGTTTSGGAGGTFTGDGGSTGGEGGSIGAVGGYTAGGGGGAGGYAQHSGNGGRGGAGLAAPSNLGYAGQNGGASGGQSSRGDGEPLAVPGTPGRGSGGGGGVGIRGQGASGDIYSSWSANGGTPGSGGSYGGTGDASTTYGSAGDGASGGGGGGSFCANANGAFGKGGNGLVRIIYGPGRSYPNNAA